MKNFLLGLSKFVLGIILAMLIVSLAGLSMAKYFMTRMSEPPDRPTYDNDLPEDRPAQRPDSSSAPIADGTADAEASADEESEDSLPEGAYRAVVNQPVGLILRSGPGTDYDQIGGLEYQQGVRVLSEESGWLKITLDNGEEGWVKGGNLDRE
ncbi:MAG: SH3 domain-containing protein [Phormidesmis sp.]